MRERGTKSGSRKSTVATLVSDSVCYCNGTREIGNQELFCNGCSKWFHGRCLQDLKEFYGLSFMVCYIFNCKDCSASKSESWIPKTANFTHMCVTALANLTADKLRRDNKLDLKSNLNEKHFFSLSDDIVPYFDTNWENLTSMPRRVKTTWHQTLQKTLSKESDLFLVSEDDPNSFALNECLADVGPTNDAVKQLGKKVTTEKGNLSSTLVNSQPPPVVEIDEGPKTRGASKRRNADSTGSNKKPKLAADYSSAKIAGQEKAIDFPFNKDGCLYYLAELDPNVPDKPPGEEEDTTSRTIPAYLYRVVTNNAVTLSPNDRAYQLRLSEDQQVITGCEGYCLARATHSVAKGTWYYEVNFLRQPNGSHIRIGWSQGLGVVQACVGYNKFSYGWRSLKGTKFHDAIGKKYHKGGFKEGDVLGMLIHLPFEKEKLQSSMLPPGRKDNTLIKFKHNHFYEIQDDVSAAAKKLVPLHGSKIEFFLNGKSCGVAFEDIYGGFYYPTVSLFSGATVRLNFGPNFRHLPKGARPMSERPNETHYEQTLSDIVQLVEMGHV